MLDRGFSLKNVWKLVYLKIIKAFDSISSDQYGSIIMDNYLRSGCQMEIEDAITTGNTYHFTYDLK